VMMSKMEVRVLLWPFMVVVVEFVVGNGGFELERELFLWDHGGSGICNTKNAYIARY